VLETASRSGFVKVAPWERLSEPLQPRWTATTTRNGAKRAHDRAAGSSSIGGRRRRMSREVSSERGAGCGGAGKFSPCAGQPQGERGLAGSELRFYRVAVLSLSLPAAGWAMNTLPAWAIIGAQTSRPIRRQALLGLLYSLLRCFLRCGLLRCAGLAGGSGLGLRGRLLHRLLGGLLNGGFLLCSCFLHSHIAS